MKKILVLEDSRKVGFGGGQKGSLQVVEALIDHFEVISADSSTDSLFATRSKAILGQPVHRLRSVGSNVGGAKSSFRIGILELTMFPFYTAWNLVGLIQLIRRTKMNAGNSILYAPLKKTLVLAWLLSLMTGMPFVYHARTVDNRDSHLYWILAFMLKRAIAILCVSTVVAKNLGMPQCQLLYNAVSTPEHVAPKQISVDTKSADPDRFVVAAFASLLQWKGLKYLIEAAGLVRNSERVEVRIYGAGPLEHELKMLCPPNCQLYGFAKNVDALLESEIHAVCTPSIHDEAFGRVPMEGNSFGLPAIVTNIGAQAEITLDGKTGYHVPPKDAQAIADAIDHMIDHPDHYHALSKRAIEHSKSFDLDAHRARILEIFQAI